MKTSVSSINNGKKGSFRKAAVFATGLGLLCLTGRTFADEPVTMAPPIDSSYSNSVDGGQGDASVSSVFNWADVPRDQQVPVRRAVFDRGGYQLYDTAGETIVIPFSNQNLYVMKFGLSDNGTTYFVNQGDAPTLYVPRGAFLENAGVPGARWYPFPQNYEYSHPVFLGVAPSWRDYCDIGWYPDMHCYGGYYCDRSFLDVGFVQPTFGLFISFGGHHYDGWDHYRNYCDYHPAPYHVTVVNNYIYNQASLPGFYGRPFQGGGGYDSNGGGGYQPYGRSRVSSNGRTLGGSHAVSGIRPNGDSRSYQASRPTFNGVDRPADSGRTSGRTYGNTIPTAGGGHVFRGAGSYGEARPVGGDHSFGGGSYNTPRPQGEAATHVFRGGSSSYGSQSSGNADRSYGSTGGQVFGSGQASGGRARTDGGSEAAGNGGGRVFNGGGRTSGASESRSYGNVDRSSGHSYGGGNSGGRTSNSSGAGTSNSSSSSGGKPANNSNGRGSGDNSRSR